MCLCFQAFTQDSSLCTSADVEDVVVSILGLDSVHCDLGQLPAARLCLQQDGSAVLGEDGPVHRWVGARKAQHLIGKLLGAGEAASVHLAGALSGARGGNVRLMVRAASGDKRWALIATGA